MTATATVRKETGEGATALRDIAIGAIVAAPRDEGAGPLLRVDALPAELQTKVSGWYSTLAKEMKEFTRAGLAIGRTLSEARTELKPLGVWMAFLNKAGIAHKTADRQANVWERTQKRLPGPVLEVVTTSGLYLAGETDDAPFGRYTKAVKRVGAPPRPTGHAEKDVEAARSWVARVVETQKRERRKVREGARTVGPVERTAESVAAAARRFSPRPTAQATFISRVMKRAMRMVEGNGRSRARSVVAA